MLGFRASKCIMIFIVWNSAVRQQVLMLKGADDLKEELYRTIVGEKYWPERLPWWSSSSESTLQCQGRRFNPWLGNLSHVSWTKSTDHNWVHRQLESPCAATKDPEWCSERPVAATETPCSQISKCFFKNCQKKKLILMKQAYSRTVCQDIHTFKSSIQCPHSRHSETI